MGNERSKKARHREIYGENGEESYISISSIVVEIINGVGDELVYLYSGGVVF